MNAGIRAFPVIEPAPPLPTLGPFPDTLSSSVDLSRRIHAQRPPMVRSSLCVTATVQGECVSTAPLISESEVKLCALLMVAVASSTMMSYPS